MQQSKDYIPLKLIASNVSRSFNFKKYNEVIFVNTGDVLEGKFLHKNITSRDGLPGQAKKAIQKNDILLTEIRPANKRFAFVHNDKNNYVVSTKFMVIVANQIVNPMYLYTVLTSNNVLRDFQSIAETRSGTFPQITFDAIADYEIYVPSKNDQSKIVSIIEVITKKIDLLKETNKTLESIAQAIFKSWFIDFDPVHAKQEGKECAGIDKATADLFPNSFVESELGSIPKGWEVKTIGECVQVVDFVANGSFAALKENVTLFKEPKYALYVRTTDYNSNFNGDFRFVDERAYRFLSKSFLVGDETIISNVGDVGTVFRAPKWLGHLMTLGSNAVALKNKEMPTYVYYFFKSNKGQHLIQSIITGSAQLKFNKTSLRSKSILIPSKSTLDCFEKITSGITEKMDTNQNGIKLLKNIRDTLLPRLISGKLDLSNIEEQLEGVA